MWLMATEYSKKETGLNQARQALVLFSARQETPESSTNQETAIWGKREGEIQLQLQE